ncbi:lipid a-disaccharide synthase, putative [Ichthyophthirius multifiliis]|uniref:lipid-A-disaccharide synthase n=1 Tax=Ichthyophthirius multifiliis TaxID=5932 RepID=G0R2N0_ICHMU|nr:lipid a-disaccharide synthase, putative [Ichthyophthirius multifiliis]EGR28294.1 lipid a-disaccharide synthase, putative [Ichthyophthirius multifiliis]|eukprot:XP_004027639.1 lipid a-disaccharide synthase, putative [Ichthyophthirius multifiliis]
MFLTKNISKTQRYMFSTSQQEKLIFIAAGSPSHDLQASRFMQSLNENSNNEYTFIGIGGPLMLQQGLRTSYDNMNKFLDKPFFPLKNFLRFHIARAYHPYMAYTHYANSKVLRHLRKETNLFEDIVNKNKVPSAFITFGNEFFMQKLYVDVLETFEVNKLLKPPTFFYNRSRFFQRYEFMEYLDHFFYTIPEVQYNYFNNFQFPSTCVGHEGVGRAIQYLFQKSKAHPNNLASQNSLRIAKDPQQHKEIVEKLVQEQRNISRKELNIPEKQHVFLLVPGNTKNEIKFAVKLLSKTITEFFKIPQLQNVSKQDFSIIITADSAENKSYIDGLLSQNPINGLQVHTVNGEEEKFAAMCAADVGIPMNGEVVSECAALQLPSVIISNMPFVWAYLNQLYNNFNSDINYSIKGEAYHELISTAANPYKLADEIFDIYNDSKLRYHFADRYANVIHEMIPKNLTSSSASTELMNLGKVEIEERGYSYNIMSNKVLKAARAYDSLDKNVPHFKLNEIRNEKLLKSAF